MVLTTIPSGKFGAEATSMIVFGLLHVSTNLIQLCDALHGVLHRGDVRTARLWVDGDVVDFDPKVPRRLEKCSVRGRGNNPDCQLNTTPSAQKRTFPA